MARVGNDRGEEAGGGKSGGKAPEGKRGGGDRLIPPNIHKGSGRTLRGIGRCIEADESVPIVSSHEERFAPIQRSLQLYLSEESTRGNLIGVQLVLERSPHTTTMPNCDGSHA